MLIFLPLRDSDPMILIDKPESKFQVSIKSHFLFPPKSKTKWKVSKESLQLK